MRAHTKEKHEMGKRFAVVIGVAAAGVMALGAQTATSSTGDPVDNVPPDLQLSGKKKQSQGFHSELPGHCCRPDVTFVASCGVVSGPPASPRESVPPANLPDMGCTLSVEGKLTKVKNDKLEPVEGDIPGPHVACYGTAAPSPATCHWQSGGKAYLHLDVTKKTRKQIHKALDDGKKVRAKITVEATDAAGNVATAKRTIKLVK